MCKVAGTGITAGTPFTFAITVGSGTPSNVTIPAGDCSTIQDVLDGTSVHIAETLDSTFRVFSASCNPGCTGLDLSAGTADITAARGVEKSVSFTNEATGP